MEKSPKCRWQTCCQTQDRCRHLHHPLPGMQEAPPPLGRTLALPESSGPSTPSLPGAGPQAQAALTSAECGPRATWFREPRTWCPQSIEQGRDPIKFQSSPRLWRPGGRVWGSLWASCGTAGIKTLERSILSRGRGTWHPVPSSAQVS